MAEPLDLLRRADEPAGAAAHRLALLAHGMAAAGRAFGGKFVRLGAPRPLLQHHVDDLRNDVAGALDRHGVADADVGAAADRIAVVADALDVVLVVQRGVLHHHAADRDRLELGDRRQRAGAADLDLDVAQHGGGALGRELVRDRPARASARRSRAAPASRAGRACRRRRRYRSRAWRACSPMSRWNASISSTDEQVVHSGLVWKPAAFNHFSMPDWLSGRHLAHLAPGVGEEVQRARRGDLGVLLAQRARRGIARIGEHRLAGLGLALVERQEVRLGHVDFAAHLADRRDVLALELVCGTSLMVRMLAVTSSPFEAVAAGRGLDQRAVLVAQRHRQAVDLRLGGEGELLVLLEIEKAADAGDEIGHVLVAEGVVQRQHRHRVAHLGEAARRRGADLARQAVQGAQVRETLLDRVVAPPQRVVFRVGDGRRVLLVVALVVRLDLGLQAGVLALGLAGRHGLDGELGIPGRFGRFHRPRNSMTRAKPQAD